MSSRKSGSLAASENVAQKQWKSVTVEEIMEVIRRMGSGQSCLTVYRDLNMAQSNVIKFIKNADKIKKDNGNCKKENC
jgi:Fe2+ or Zn2+ uptake regulation protein